MKKQSLIRGSLILGMTGILAKFLGLFFRWPLIMLIGDEGIGYYQLSYPLYMFYVAMASGVPVAVSKIISEKNAVGDVNGIYEVVKESSYLMALIGIGTSLILFFFSKPLISFLKWDYKAYYALVGISFAPMIVSFVTVFRGFFQGLQNMTPSGISQVLEQIGRVVIGVGMAIIFLPKGIEYAAGGAALGAAAGGLFALFYLFTKYKLTKREFGIKKIRTNTNLLNDILKISIPISIGTTVGSIMSLIDSILVPQKLLEAGLNEKTATILYGQLTGKASVLVNIPLTLSMAICTSLIPIIAEKYVLKDKRELQDKMNLAIKLSTFIAFPCMIGLFILAYPVLKLLFPNNYEGSSILMYLSVSIPFIIITQTTTSILQATNHYIRPVINLFLGCIVKVILTITLVPIKEINIYGAVIASVSAYIVVALLNIRFVKINNGEIKVKESFISPFISAIIMGIGVFFAYVNCMKKINNNSISCLFAIFIGIIIYMICIVEFKVFKLEDIKNRIVRKS